MPSAERLRLQQALERKRAKLRTARADLAHRENVIQDLLTLRLFLRASIEWIKVSVAERFPTYNSLLYTAAFSNFGLLVTNAFLDFMSIGEGSDSSAEPEVFWIPYIVWAVLGVAGWLLDRYVSKKSSLGTKLDKVQACTFGAISQQSMRTALATGETSELESLLAEPLPVEMHYKLGQV